MPEYINKPAHARAQPAYVAIYARRGWDGQPFSAAEYWTPFVTPFATVEARTRLTGPGDGGHSLLGITDVAKQVTYLP